MKFSIALFAILSASVQAAPMSTCGTQADCLDFSINKVSDGSKLCSGDCEFIVCMTVNYNDSCVKKSGTISHTCEKPDDVCAVNNGFSGSTEKGGIPNEYKSCQIVNAGETAEFLMKDGSGSCNEGANTYGIATCGALEDKYPYDDFDGSQSCTGNKDTECLWLVEAPPCTTDPETDPDDVGSAPVPETSSENLRGTIGTAAEDDAAYLCA
jgi:hypothetical protein